MTAPGLDPLPTPSDRRSPIATLRTSPATAAAALLLAALLALGQWPYFVEHVYARGLSPFLCRTLAMATGWLPISLAEVCLAGGTLAVLLLGGRALWRVATRRARAWPTLRAGLWQLARGAVFVACGFYAVWGLNYAREAMPQRLGWAALAPPDRAAQAEELRALCTEAVQRANAAYRDTFATDDVGTVTRWPGSAGDLERALDVGLDEAGRRLGLEPTFLGSRGPSKRPRLLAPLMTRLYLSGFFFPWTGEANVNPQPPDCTTLHIVAHEKSHQRGLAREDEAEFVGFLAGAHAPHPYLRYAAHLFAQHVLLRELGRVDQQAQRALIGTRLPGVARDVDAVAEFWDRHYGKLVRISVAVNDTYLKTHGIAQGVLNYGAAAELLVRYARQRVPMDSDRK